MTKPLRVFYSYRPYGTWGINDPNARIGWQIRQWCFSNLCRPATITFYDKYQRFDHRAQLYRRQTKILGLYGSWSREVNGVIEVYYEIDFEYPMDEDLFLLCWLGKLKVVDEFPEPPQ